MLPKYQYASAGSLYSVQTYVIVSPKACESMSELDSAGLYYYDPVGHGLLHVGAWDPMFLNIEEPNAPVVVLLGKDKAIRPLYGPMADVLNPLNAGYMVGALVYQQQVR